MIEFFKPVTTLLKAYKKHLDTIPYKLYEFLFDQIEANNGSDLRSVFVDFVMTVQDDVASESDTAERVDLYPPYGVLYEQLYFTLLPELVAKAEQDEAIWEKVAARWKTPEYRRRYAEMAAKGVVGSYELTAKKCWEYRRDKDVNLLIRRYQEERSFVDATKELELHFPDLQLL
jgi:hypothetical protein